MSSLYGLTQSQEPSTGEVALIDNAKGEGVTEREEHGIELLLSEPDIVAWLEPPHEDDDDEDESPRAA